MTALAWVMGRGGLLGSHVAAEISRRVGWREFRAGPFSWGESASLREEIAAAMVRFAAEGASARSWAVFWCAGAATVGASTASLAAESDAFDDFLARLGESGPPASLAGSVFLASSAGGVWGGCPDRPITEASPPRPISAYGAAQLEKELALARWAAGRRHVSTLAARLSNLYGPGQALGKSQGLISYFSRSLIRGSPAHVFVDLDTIRDYLYVEDAARAAVAAVERLEEERSRAEAPSHVLKIIASEEVTTIGQLVGAFRRTTKRPLRVVTGLHAVANQQPSCLQFRSTVWREATPATNTGLLEGIERVFRHELARFLAGSLPPAQVE